MGRYADPMYKARMSERALKHQQQANRSHGMYAYQKRGEDALEPIQLSRYQELKTLFDSEPGRVEYRKDLAAHVAMILELGFANLRELAESNQTIWDKPPIRAMGTYLNTFVRLLDGWPKDAGDPQDITDILRGGKDE
jgi:hypothetical protein